MKPMKLPDSNKSPRTVKLIGQSSQAPGLKQRDNGELQKALGISPNIPIHPIALADLAKNHPNDKVRQLAAFQLKGMNKA